MRENMDADLDACRGELGLVGNALGLPDLHSTDVVAVRVPAQMTVDVIKILDCPPAS
jgi:hypothetical protein